MQRLLGALDARDRALLARWMLDPSASGWRRAIWGLVTHAGGARVTIVLALLPIAAAAFAPRPGARIASIGWDAALALALSHGAVQLLKRTALRPRPGGAGDRAPDPFSFPSGHACAALAVALVYALHQPWLAAPAVGLAAIVGYSRVVLGVHFPGDVLVGQMIAALTAVLVVAA